MGINPFNAVSNPMRKGTVISIVQVGKLRAGEVGRCAQRYS